MDNDIAIWRVIEVRSYTEGWCASGSIQTCLKLYLKLLWGGRR